MVCTPASGNGKTALLPELSASQCITHAYMCLGVRCDGGACFRLAAAITVRNRCTRGDELRQALFYTQKLPDSISNTPIS
jgi:hypothetical protein